MAYMELFERLTEEFRSGRNMCDKIRKEIVELGEAWAYHRNCNGLDVDSMNSTYELNSSNEELIDGFTKDCKLRKIK
jgi:hypothetical protein